MSDIAGIVLHNLLKEPDKSLEVWPKLKLYFFNSEYSQIYVAVSKYYNKYHKLPSFNELTLYLRDKSLKQKITALQMLPVPEDIDNLIATEALVDQYIQEETLTHLYEFVDNISHYDNNEIKQKIQELLMYLEERTYNSEEIVLMNDLLIMDKEEKHKKITLGLNNSFDAKTGGVSLTELIMLGGARGSGKTIAGCNIAANQYRQGNIGLFFSIEMRSREIFNRFMSILSGVPNENLSRMKCSREDFDNLAKARADMFVDSEEVLQDYYKHNDYEKFELDLIRSKKLSQEKGLIIVDNQMLSLADIDLNIQKFKAQYGDKLKVVVVDYVNQIQLPDLYDWKTQIKLSKELKNLARKYEIAMVTPYQIDKTGEARFAKGLLDAADIAVNLEAHENYLSFNSTKTRNISSFSFNSPINWDTLEISPEDAVIDRPDGDEPPPKIGSKKTVEPPQELPF